MKFASFILIWVFCYSCFATIVPKPTGCGSDVASQGGEVDTLLIGSDPAIIKVRETLRKIAKTSLNVLVYGETGTGKEVVAQELRRLSEVQAFVARNMAAIPETVAESELFGHKKGSFTGASADRNGCFHEADGGIFFLDEITLMKPNLQASLLRVLESGEVTPVGGKTFKVTVRFIAATNIAPLQAVKEGKLREDLYYRLNTIEIYLPPLRARRWDIPMLAQHFQKTQKPLSVELQSRLMAYDWPGNVRELRNVMEYVEALSGDDPILQPKHLPDRFNKFEAVGQMIPHREERNSIHPTLDELSRLYFTDLMLTHDMNVQEVAKIAEIPLPNLIGDLRRWGMLSPEPTAGKIPRKD